MIEDFTARRRAAIEAKRLLVEVKAEDERDYQVHCAEREFEDWLERERIKRQKYEEAMAEKRTIAAFRCVDCGKDTGESGEY